MRFDYEYASENHNLTAAQDQGTGQFDSYSYTPKATTFVSMRAGTTISKWNVSAFVDNLFNAHPELPPSSYPHSDVDPYNANAPAPLIRTYTFRPRTIGRRRPIASDRGRASKNASNRQRFEAFFFLRRPSRGNLEARGGSRSS